MAQNESHKNLADQIIQNLKTASNVSQESLDRDLIIIDRHYVTLGGQVVKSTSTLFNRVLSGRADSPYLVSTWNAPKPEIKINPKLSSRLCKP